MAPDEMSVKVLPSKVDPGLERMPSVMLRPLPPIRLNMFDWKVIEDESCTVTAAGGGRGDAGGRKAAVADLITGLPFTVTPSVTVWVIRLIVSDTPVVVTPAALDRVACVASVTAEIVVFAPRLPV